MTLRTLALAALLAAAPAYATIAIEGLPDDAPRSGTVVTIDVSTNQVYLFRDGELIRKSAAATGSDKILRNGRRVWWFRTPRGMYEVVRKVKDPVWTKPDWAFIEEGKPIPPPDSPSRRDYDTLGKYAFHLGDRIMLHGTNDPRSIGKKVTHGCIRLPKDMLERMWKEVSVGTPVFIFDSRPELARLPGSEKGMNDLDL